MLFTRYGNLGVLAASVFVELLPDFDHKVKHLQKTVGIILCWYYRYEHHTKLVDPVKTLS